MNTHEILINAFKSIPDKNALAWSVIDTKSELTVTSAIAISANRLAGVRIAHVEYPPRVDLVFKGAGGEVTQAYLAKAGYMTDFQPGAITRSNPSLGGHFNKDLEKLSAICSRLGREVFGAGLFYLYEVSDPSRQTKYGGLPKVPLDKAVSTLERFAPCSVLVGREMLDCGIADGTAVRLHMCIFNPV